MAKKKRKGKMPPGLARWHREQRAKKHGGKKRKSGKRKSKHRASTTHTGGHVAKRKRSKHRKGHRKGHRRGGGGGGMLAGIPIPEIVAGAAIGFVERSGKADPNFILNKLPAPIDQLGRTGNTTLILWAATKFGIVPSSMRQYAVHAIKAGATITAYNISKQGAAFAKGDAVSGPDMLGRHGRAHHGRRELDVEDHGEEDWEDDEDGEEEHLAGDDELAGVEDEMSGYDVHATVEHTEDVHAEAAPANG